MPVSDYLTLGPEVEAALEAGAPVVALESAVISHGLPRPQNVEAARRVEAAIREEGATPATVGIIGGQIVVGLNDDEIRTLALDEDVMKISRRDVPLAVAHRAHGGTTVAGTMIAAFLAGIRVFSTGGIGGVHRGDADDVSADLPELAMTSMAVVCAGAKAILDLPRTLEYLETAGVPVLGYETDEFPAFYTPSSGLPVDARVNSPEEVAALLRVKWELGLEGGVLVAVPPPEDAALPPDEVESAVAAAQQAAYEAGITGGDLTPFMLSEVTALTGGRSLDTNIALLENNARIGARIAAALNTIMAM